MEFQFEVKLTARIDGTNQWHALMRLRELLQDGDAIVGYVGAGEIRKPITIVRVKDVGIEIPERSQVNSEETSKETTL